MSTAASTSKSNSFAPAARLPKTTVHAEPVCAVIESMTGARFVHDTLEQAGWAVEIADAQKVKGLAPLACKTEQTPGDNRAGVREHQVQPPDRPLLTPRQIRLQVEWRLITATHNLLLKLHRSQNALATA